ncbi:hypothetical protein LWF01_05015 [Saxibacter everestensis]|uniref:Uncharacterized protein n=1 Tax=Saxibacter everestensis TaxID=2909229 RepID=A0ABY8QVZ6_9MICO|nr:hypothetical protein LWF01_05015 [Brevibacteriaceae bacterium ZFBP1038]
MTSGVGALVFWPQTPLLIDGVNADDDAALAELRSACSAAFAAARKATGADAQILVLAERPDDAGPAGEPASTGPAGEPASTGPAGEPASTGVSYGTLAGFGVERTVLLRNGRLEPDSVPPDDAVPLGPNATVALLLLAEISAADAGPIRVVELDRPGFDPGHIDSSGQFETTAPVAWLLEISASRPTIVLVCGDGSARSTRMSPGPYHPDADGFDQQIFGALSESDPEALIRATTTDSTELQVSGVAAWRTAAALAHLLPESAATDGSGAENGFRTAVRFTNRPFGVRYFVATWTLTKPSSS